MESKAPLCHFLGANSRQGFYSLYRHISRPEEGEFLHIIKGGPGCGKSGFMRRIAAAAAERGLRAEYILCSGDPDSLDALILPELKMAWMDGTAPHAAEAMYAAGSSAYVDLGSFYDISALRPLNGDIMELADRSRQLYACAYKTLEAAAAALPRNCLPPFSADPLPRMEKKLRSLAARELPELERPGRFSRRFISASCCKGRLLLPIPARRLWLLDGRTAAAELYLERFSRMALERGYSITLWQDSLEPEKLSGVFIPELDLALLAPEAGTAVEAEAEKLISTESLTGRSELSSLRSRMRKLDKLSRGLLDCATETLARAKAVHDELEALYNPHVDFQGVAALADEHIKRFLP